MMLEMKTTDFLDALSSSAPVPGGGGASAAAGAMGAALGMMVANLTAGKKKYADVEEEIIAIRRQLYDLQQRLVLLTDEDAKAFEPLSKAYGLPRSTPEEQKKKAEVMEAALYEASRPPLEMMETVLEVMRLLEILGEKGSRIAVSDVGVGISFCQATLEGASMNVFINTKSMKNRERAEEMNCRADAMIAEGTVIKERVSRKVEGQIR